MSKEDKRFLIIISALAVLVVALVATIIIVANNRRQNALPLPPVSNIPELTEEEFDNLSREEKTDYFLLTLWGEDYESRVFNKEPTPSPFPTVDISTVPITTKTELELISYTIITMNPSLLLSPNADTVVELVEGVKVDLQKRKDTYTGIQYQLIENDWILVSGYRNGEPFRLTFEEAGE